jgi:predicted Ser/Thr protein kinase
MKKKNPIRKLTKFDGYKVNTEVHFICLWEKQNTHTKKLLYEKIEEYGKDVRIIKTDKIEQRNMKQLFKDVESGGKHNLHDIEIFFIEVPSVYKMRNTYSHPNGESVNNFMYEIKSYIRNGYTNYKKAHGSFNLKESNDFFSQYFKFLGNFKNFLEFKKVLYNSNIFWVFDRLTIDLTHDQDIDMVVDSIPSICFILRSVQIHHKIYINLNNRKILIDLRSFLSNYYPSEWLEDIKNKNMIRINNFAIHPDLKNHYMMGLYHKFIHKNGVQNESRTRKLEKMRKHLGYKTNDITTLLSFLNTKNYVIPTPNDKNVGFHVSNLTQGNEIGKKVYKYKKRFFYLYNDRLIYEKNISTLQILQKYKIVPMIIFKDNVSLLIEVENTGEKLSNSSIIHDLVSQIKFINSVLDSEKIIHNDLTSNNITVKNEKLYLIDFDWSVSKFDKIVKRNNNYCSKLPIPTNNDIIRYINDNECLQ